MVEILDNFQKTLENIESTLTNFVNFQLDQMYFRYFMWNFSGRQNDKQWNYDVEIGNCLSGINVIDDFM